MGELLIVVDTMLLSNYMMYDRRVNC